ncbi:epimerase [Primorskyibacter sp. 2E107]|uniref:epimerase n=1 Tax=Primorskyibacter sp. 2E107 TaxID=3403458 RepID=UPI003AF8D0F9
MTGTALILGGTGRFGRNTAEAFWNAGWRVTLFDRTKDDLMRAAEGQDVIVNGWNPPYTRWAAELPDLTRQVIAAGRASGATVLLPGNVYVYGPQAPEIWSDQTPHVAQNPLGRLRRDMEATYRDSGVQTILLRAGDFFDTEASGNWFDRVMAPTLRRGVLTYPGALDRPHAWAFLPDLSTAAVMLAERRAELPGYADIAFPGYTLTGAEMAALCSEVLGRSITAKPMNWLPLRLAAPFGGMARTLLEMRYLWNKPHRLDGTAFEAILPDFRSTAPQEAIARAIAPVLNPASEGQPKQADAVPRPARAG